MWCTYWFAHVWCVRGTARLAFYLQAPASAPRACTKDSSSCSSMQEAATRSVQGVRMFVRACVCVCVCARIACICLYGVPVLFLKLAGNVEAHKALLHSIFTCMPDFRLHIEHRQTVHSFYNTCTRTHMLTVRHM
jgi:hypothetical protein